MRGSSPLEMDRGSFRGMRPAGLAAGDVYQARIPISGGKRNPRNAVDALVDPLPWVESAGRTVGRRIDGGKTLFRIPTGGDRGNPEIPFGFDRGRRLRGANHHDARRPAPDHAGLV